MGNCSEIGVPDFPPPPHWGISLLFVDNENNHNDSLDGPRDGKETHAGLEIRSARVFLSACLPHRCLRPRFSSLAILRVFQERPWVLDLKRVSVNQTLGTDYKGTGFLLI